MVEECPRDPVYLVFWFLAQVLLNQVLCPPCFVVHTYDFLCGPCFSQSPAFIRLTRLLVLVYYILGGNCWFVGVPVGYEALSWSNRSDALAASVFVAVTGWLPLVAIYCAVLFRQAV